jgi:hypothetical protein
MAVRKILAIPVSRENSMLIILTTTTVERKWGR